MSRQFYFAQSAVNSNEKTTKEKRLGVVLLCDTDHDLKSDYSEIRVIGAGADAVDFALVNLVVRWQND